MYHYNLLLWLNIIRHFSKLYILDLKAVILPNINCSSFYLLFHSRGYFLGLYNMLSPTTSPRIISGFSKRIFSVAALESTKDFSQIWLKINRLSLVADYWCNIPFTLSLPFFNLFQNSTVGGCNFDRIRWNKYWSILFWYSCCKSCCNILDSGFYALCVFLHW